MTQLHNVRVLVCTRIPETSDAIRSRLEGTVQVSSVCLSCTVGEEAEFLAKLNEEIRRTQAHIVFMESSMIRLNRAVQIETSQPRRFVLFHDQPTIDIRMILESQLSNYWMIEDQTLEPDLIERLLNQIIWQERARTLAVEQEEVLRRFAHDYYENLPSEQIIRQQLTQREIEQEFGEALERLFPGNQRVSIEPMPVHHPQGNRQISHIPRSRSQVFLVNFKGDRLPAVVKIAREQKIRREIENFRKNVQYKIGGLRHAVVEKDIILWNVGAIAYSFIGATEEPLDADDSTQTIPTLGSYILNTRDMEDLSTLIRGLYKSWQLHYRHRETLYGNLRLYGQYNEAWDLKLDTILSSPPSVDIDLFQPGPGPFQWLKHRKDSTPFARQRCIIHGDMHADNVFVDGQYCWFIDFERSTYGPVLQDFVELEVDLMTRLLDLDPDNEDERDVLYDFYVAVCEHKRPTSPVLFSPATSQNAQTRKFTNLVAIIRSQAQEHTEYVDSRDYLWGVLFNCIFRAAYSAGDPARDKLRKRSLLLASLLCSRLENWEVSSRPPEWPPQHWPAVDLRSLDERDPIIDRPSHFGHGYALLIGVGPTPDVPRLSLGVSASDTTALAQVLIDQQRCGYLPGNVRVLTNALANLGQIRREFEWLGKIVEGDPNATAIIYFSGHGVRYRINGQDDRYGLIPSDIQLGQDRFLMEETVLWSNELVDLLETIQARKLLVLIDSCHAEGMARKDDMGLLSNDILHKSPPTFTTPNKVRKWARTRHY